MLLNAVQFATPLNAFFTPKCFIFTFFSSQNYKLTNHLFTFAVVFFSFFFSTLAKCEFNFNETMLTVKCLVFKENYDYLQKYSSIWDTITFSCDLFICLRTQCGRSRQCPPKNIDLIFGKCVCFLILTGHFSRFLAAKEINQRWQSQKLCSKM